MDTPTILHVYHMKYTCFIPAQKQVRTNLDREAPGTETKCDSSLQFHKELYMSQLNSKRILPGKTKGKIDGARETIPVPEEKN